jgi:dihydrofolate reductase
MLGAVGRRVKAATLVVLLAGGCGWRDTTRMTATHAAVLTSIARKGYELVVAGRLTAETMPELTYPLERAQAFVASRTPRAAGHDREALAALAALVERYRRFVDVLDRVRRERTPHGLRALARELRQVRAASRDVRTAIRGGASPAR